MTSLGAEVNIYAEVWAAKSYSDLAITCKISEDHVSMLDLTDGQPLSDQSGVATSEVNSTQQYLLTVPGGHSVECVTSCDNGDANLKLRFSDPALPESCSSGSNSSNEVCKATAPYRPDDYLVYDDFVDPTTLYAEVYSDGAYSNLTITCNISEGLASVALVEGETLDGQDGEYHISTFYTLDVPAGHFVDCEIEGDNGDADLHMFFDDPEDEEDCYTGDGSYEFCSATAPAGGDFSTLHAEVHAFREYSNLSITCTTSPPTQSPTLSPNMPTKSPTNSPMVTEEEPNCPVRGLFGHECK
jgi:hypothetical protein